MSVVSYPLGTPLDAEWRGGDCRARDLSQGRNVHGTHRFAATTHCRINNGLLRLTVGASGAVPALTVEGRRGRVTVDDYLTDTLTDTLDGSISTPEWIAMGTVTIDSPSVAALLTAVRIVQVNAEAITIQLVAPTISDAFVTLKRGERQVHVQHGSTGAPLQRRIRWTAAPSPVGVAYRGRVQEDLPKVHGFPRVLSSHGPSTTNAGAFSLTATATYVLFGAGIGVDAPWDRTHDQHAQLSNSSRPSLVVD